jgi:hypothetical protein
VPRELPAEQEERHVGADQGDGEQHALEDAQPGAGEQVVGERVAEQAFGERQGEQDDADDPVELARLAVGAGEEDPQHVAQDRGHEQDGCPVVDLPHEQPATDVEADVQRGRVRLAHVHAVQRRVGAVIDHVGHARLEEEGEEGAGEQQDDERVQRDLAEQEAPVIGEDLPQEPADGRCRAQAVVEEPAGAGD